MIRKEECFTINRDKFISSSFGDEIMLMNLETGDYVALNVVSADIYRIAEQKTSAEKIINTLLQQYQVNEQECREQVMTCIESMIKKDMLIKL